MQFARFFPVTRKCYYFQGGDYALAYDQVSCISSCIHQNSIARYNNGLTLSNGKAKAKIKEVFPTVRYTRLWNCSQTRFFSRCI